jgi:hypothetical protein
MVVILDFHFSHTSQQVCKILWKSKTVTSNFAKKWLIWHGMTPTRYVGRQEH